MNPDSNTWVGRFSFWFVIANFVVFSTILVLVPKTYKILAKEDNFVEYTGALLFFLCGLVLLSCTLQRFPARLPQVLLGFTGLIFIVAAGEEVSWGQRIFGWTTPEAMIEINNQNETNFHNIDTKFFNKLYDRAIFVLLLVSTFCYFRKIKQIFHIPLPSLLMVLCLCLMSFYRYEESIIDLDTRRLIYIIAAIVAIGFLVIRKNYLPVIYPAVALIAALFILLWHQYLSATFHSLVEVREYLFAFCCLMVAIEMRLNIIRNLENKSFEPGD